MRRLMADDADSGNRRGLLGQQQLLARLNLQTDTACTGNRRGFTGRLSPVCFSGIAI
jgi:hypothetical protein